MCNDTVILPPSGIQCSALACLCGGDAAAAVTSAAAAMFAAVSTATVTPLVAPLSSRRCQRDRGGDDQLHHRDGVQHTVDGAACCVWCVGCDVAAAASGGTLVSTSTAIVVAMLVPRLGADDSARLQFGLSRFVRRVIGSDATRVVICVRMQGCRRVPVCVMTVWCFRRMGASMCVCV